MLQLQQWLSQSFTEDEPHNSSFGKRQGQYTNSSSNLLNIYTVQINILEDMIKCTLHIEIDYKLLLPI